MTLRRFESAILTRPQDRTPQQQVAVEALKAAEAETARIQQAILDKAKPVGDLPLRPPPSLPDLSALYNIDLTLETNAVKDARAEISDLEEQISFVIVRLGAIPIEIDDMKAKLARSGDPEDAGRIVYLREELEALETFRLPEVQTELEQARAFLAQVEAQTRADVFATMAAEVDEIDLTILDSLRDLLALRLRSRILRDAANGLQPASGHHLGDWISMIFSFIRDIGRNISADDIYKFEKRIVERTPTKYWRE